MLQIMMYPTYGSLHIVSYFSASGHKKSIKETCKKAKSGNLSQSITAMTDFLQKYAGASHSCLVRDLNI